MNKETIDLFNEKGLEVIEEINSNTYRVLVKECKHETTIYTHNLKPTNRYKCNLCINEEFIRRCEINNLEVLENPAKNINFNEPSKWAKFLRKDCGHTLTCIRSSLSKLPKCSVCVSNSILKKLENNGLELVEKSPSIKSLYRFKKCGHTRILFDIAAQRGNAVCHECKLSSQTEPSKLYVLKFRTTNGMEFIKFGYGKNTDNRIREYQLRNIESVDKLFELGIPTGSIARTIEKAIHKKFTEYKLSNFFMKFFLTKTGYSECYHVEIHDQLISEIQSFIKESYNAK